MKIKILIPVYNDFQSASKLIVDINSVISNLNEEFSIIIINDASTEKAEINVSNIDKIKSVKIINMKENQGHARCIASGMKYIFDNDKLESGHPDFLLIYCIQMREISDYSFFHFL